MVKLITSLAALVPIFAFGNSSTQIANLDPALVNAGVRAIQMQLTNTAGFEMNIAPQEFSIEPNGNVESITYLAQWQEDRQIIIDNEFGDVHEEFYLVTCSFKYLFKPSTSEVIELSGGQCR